MKLIQYLIFDTFLAAGDMELSVAHKLYNRGLVYLDVPVSDDDCITMPPLEGTVRSTSIQIITGHGLPSVSLFS